VDDLHPDSDDANTAKTSSDDQSSNGGAQHAGDDAQDAAVNAVDEENAAPTEHAVAVASDSQAMGFAPSAHASNGNTPTSSEAHGTDSAASDETTPDETPTIPHEAVSAPKGAASPEDEAEATSDSIAQEVDPAVATPETAPIDAAFDEATTSANDMPDDEAAVEAASPLELNYTTLQEVGHDQWGRILLAWHTNSSEGDDQDPPVILLERATLDIAAAQHVIDFHLYHARLLAPRAALIREGGLRLLVVDAPASYEAPFTSIGEGGKLDAKSAVKAGVGLANALSYLHTNGFVHRNVGPGSILVHDGRAYLSGVELASAIDTAESAEAPSDELQIADVNALAKSLASLAGLSDVADPDESGSARALRAVAAKGAVGAFKAAEDLAQECGQALQEPTLTLPPAAEPISTRALAFRTGTATTVGLLRTQNQDALGCTVLEIHDDVGRDQPLGIFLVADGMGGEAAGEIASRIGARIATAELVRQLLVPTVAMPALEPFSPDHTTGAISVSTLAQALAIAVDAANRQVRALAAALQEATGTTLTCVVAAGSRAVLAHLGDSRAYLLRNGTLVQLTKDHSLLARLTELDHPLLNDPSFGMPRNYLYRSLGQEDDAPPDMTEFPLASGDRMLLCSDGLWDELDDATIQQCLTSTDDPEECANHLVRLANASGGHDNSTAVVAFVEGQRDDPASEISPEQVEAILRATGAYDESDEEDDGGDIADDAFGADAH
jgi:PPM family protein phosphatase